MGSLYKTEEFPDEKTLKKEALGCSMLAYCPDRPFSFCLKKWIELDDELLFRKITFKHCYECQHRVHGE